MINGIMYSIWCGYTYILRCPCFCVIINLSVRESQSSQSPQSPPTTHTRSNSPDYWSPPPVTISTHSSRTVTVWSQTFHVDSPDPLSFCLQSRRSCVPLADLHRSCAPPSPSSISSLDKVKDWLLTDKTLEASPFLIHSPGLAALLHFPAIVQ